MGQQICCTLESSSHEKEITHDQKEKGQVVQKKGCQDRKEEKQEQKENRNLQDFYGAKDISVTKTMTKQSKMTNQMEEKLKSFDIIMEESNDQTSLDHSFGQDKSRNSRLSAQEG